MFYVVTISFPLDIESNFKGSKSYYAYYVLYLYHFHSQKHLNCICYESSIQYPN